MATNNFKAFALDPNANVMSQADWEALPALLSGFTAGKASSAQVNKAIRQASFIAAALAQYTSDKTGDDVLDDGDQAAFIAKMAAAFGKDFQPLDATLTALAALTGAVDKLPYFNGADTAALTALTTVGRDIIGKSSIADVLSYLGLLTNQSVGRLIGVRTFTSSATYIPTPGTTEIIVEVIGGGGGTDYCHSQGPSNLCTSGGGGGGSYATGRYTSGFSSVAVTIGTGGAGGIVTSATGPSAGGTSSFGSLISCPGGNIGIAYSTASSYSFFGSPGNGGALPTGSGIVYRAMGGPGGFGFYLGPTTLGGNGGANGKGGGGPIGSGITSAGVTATTPGAGGSGGSAGPGSAGANGGSGAPGIVVVYELA